MTRLAARAGMLMSTIAEVKRKGGEYRTLHLYGQERNHMTASIARMNLALHGVENFAIARGDTLERPAFVVRDRLRRYSIVLANPPYSIKQWNRAGWEHDPWGRNFLGTPPQGRADYAFFQHILASMDARKGRGAILFPHGVLFRKEEAEMRKKTGRGRPGGVCAGAGAEPVLQLADGGVRGGVPQPQAGGATGAHPVYRRRCRSSARAGAELSASQEHQRRILAAYHAFADEPGFARVATAAEIAGQEYSLSIPLYVKRTQNGAGQRASESRHPADALGGVGAERAGVLAGDG